MRGKITQKCVEALELLEGLDPKTTPYEEFQTAIGKADAALLFAASKAELLITNIRYASTGNHGVENPDCAAGNIKVLKSKLTEIKNVIAKI